MSTAIDTTVPALNRNTGASWEQSYPNEKRREASAEDAIDPREEKEETYDDHDVLVFHYSDSVGTCLIQITPIARDLFLSDPTISRKTISLHSGSSQVPCLGVSVLILVMVDQFSSDVL
jgi:hypothetical protein